MSIAIGTAFTVFVPVSKADALRGINRFEQKKLRDAVVHAERACGVKLEMQPPGPIEIDGRWGLEQRGRVVGHSRV